MSWLSSPKVRLALIVNGLYLFSHFTPTIPYTRPRLFAHTRVPPAERAAQPFYVPLPPPSAPSRASANESGGFLNVSLTKDLTLVRLPGRTVLLSPSLSVRTYPPEEPNSVLFNFIIYADKETCPDNCLLNITADGKPVWSLDTSAGTPAYSPGWKRERVPHSATKLADGRLVESMAAESLSMSIPYEQFVAMVSAKRVVIRLGTDRAELTNDQLDALREMHRRLPQPLPPAQISVEYKLRSYK